MKRSDFELMSPVGSYESLVAAHQGGADAIYFGVEQLNMRAGSANSFSLDDMTKIADFCREKGMKSYLTLNVVVYDRESERMKKVLDHAKESGITAVIASDLSVILSARERGINVHLSTQTNITNVEAIQFYSGWTDVVVLARELNLDQVRFIYDEIRRREIKGPGGDYIKLEVFVHGALCMAVSGKCYLSLHENNASANRGTCYQTCRKSYVVTEKETGYQLEIDNEYIMSPKDLCTIGFLDRVAEAGARVLKIEGRARSPEYVLKVTKAYNEALSAVIEGSFTGEKAQEWRKELETVFNRGFWDGYYLGQKMGEWSGGYGSSATRRRVYLGKVTNYFAKIGVAEIKLETGSLSAGETIHITGPTTGVMEIVAGEIRVDLKPVESAEKGEYLSVAVPDIVRRSDSVYRWVDASQVKKQ